VNLAGIKLLFQLEERLGERQATQR
jgi:hypothetical protein